MAQQTAVEKIYEQLEVNDPDFWNAAMIRDWFMENKERFLQMEKEQISKAWDDGDYAYFHSKETGRDFDNGEQYYNETYNK